MLKVRATLPEAQHFRQTQPKGDRHQWADRATDALRVLAPTPDPWDQTWDILIRLEQGKTRAGLRYPKRLTLLCLPPEEPAPPTANILRERWKGLFAHTCEPTLLAAVFPAAQGEAQGWLILSILPAAGVD